MASIQAFAYLSALIFLFSSVSLLLIDFLLSLPVRLQLILMGVEGEPLKKELANEGSGGWRGRR